MDKLNLPFVFPVPNTLMLSSLDNEIKEQMTAKILKQRPRMSAPEATRLHNSVQYNTLAFELLKAALYKNETPKAKALIYLMIAQSPERAWSILGSKLLSFFEYQEKYLSSASEEIIKDTVCAVLPASSALNYYQSLIYLKNSVGRSKTHNDSYIKNVRLHTLTKVISWVGEILEKNSDILPQQKDLQDFNSNVSALLSGPVVEIKAIEFFKINKPVIDMALGYIHKINHRNFYPNLNPAEFDKIIPDIRLFIRQGHKLFTNIDNIIHFRDYFERDENQNFTSFFFNNEKFIPSLIEKNTEENIIKLAQNLENNSNFQKEIRSLFLLKPITAPSYWSKTLNKTDKYLLKHNILLLNCLSPQDIEVSKIKLPQNKNQLIDCSNALLNALEGVFKKERSQEELSVLLAQKKLSLFIAPVEVNSANKAKRHKI